MAAMLQGPGGNDESGCELVDTGGGDANEDSEVGLVVVCPLTNRIKGHPFEVEIPAGRKASGAVLSDQVQSMDWCTRKASFLCAMPEAAAREVPNNCATLLGA